MSRTSAKRIAKVKLALSKRTADVLEPADKPWIAWDDKLVGFGCRIQASGTKSFIANYRAGERADARALPTLGEACDDYIETGRHRADVTQRVYRRHPNLYLNDWCSCALDAITRRDIERVELEVGSFRVDETKTGAPLELPITPQLGEILAHCKGTLRE